MDTTFIENLLPSVSGYIPKIALILAVLFFGWLIAKFVAGIFKRVLQSIGLGKKLEEYGIFKVEKAVSKLVYYILMVIVLMVALDLMGVNNVLEPLQNMVNEFVAFLPNIIAAGIIGYVGYVLAKIVSETVAIGGSFFERNIQKAGISNSVGLLSVLKKVIFVFVFVPILIVAINALNMETLSVPATHMLQQFMDAIPNIVAAAVVVTVFYYLGGFISNMLRDLLFNMNFDSLPKKVGLSEVIGNETSVSKLVGNIAYFFIIFSGIIIAVEKLNFQHMSEILSNLMVLSSKILLGLVILTLGNFIATVAKKSITNNKITSKIVYFALLSLFLAMGLRSMGLADDIVNLAFGLTLGAAAIAFALAFGLGGREAAGKELAEWFKKLKE